MDKLKLKAAESTYVETPKGLFTAAGVWFRTTEKALQRYARPVLDREPLPRLLAHAEMWLRSPETLLLWALPLLLWVLAPLPAALIALALYIGWRILGPSFVTWTAVPVVKVLDKVLVQAGYYVFALSMLSAQAGYTPVWVGLGGFILARWGVLAKVTDPLIQRLWKALYALPVPDQVLRALIIRIAMKHRLSLPQLDRIEKQIFENMNANR